MTKHTKKFKESETYELCHSFLREAYNRIKNVIEPDLALSMLSEAEIIELFEFTSHRQIQSYLPNKSRDYKQILVQMYFAFLLRDPSEDVLFEIDVLSDEMYEGINYFYGRTFGFTISQLKQIQQAAFRTEDGKIDWEYYADYISRMDEMDDRFVTVTCGAAQQLLSGSIDKREAKFCVRHYDRGISPHHFIKKPQWAHHTMWKTNDGHFTSFYATLLANNPTFSGDEVYNLVNNMTNDTAEHHYFHFRFLADTYHLGIRYDDIKDIEPAECSVLDKSIGHLMKQKNISFHHACSELDGLSYLETYLYIYLQQHGLTKKELTDTQFHRRHFLGSSSAGYFKSFVTLSLETFFLSPIIEAFSWPEKELTHEHYSLILKASYIVDKNGKMPDFKKVIAWVETLTKEQAKELTDCMNQITDKLLYQADQLTVLKQHEDAIPPEQQWRGRPPYQDYLAPLAYPAIRLRMENNKRNGRVIADCELDYNAQTPIQSFLLACGSHYDLSYVDIADLSCLEACEYTCGFIGYRIEQPGEAYCTILSGLSHDDTMIKMMDPRFNLHEKRVLGHLSPYGLKEDDLLKSPLHTNPANPFSYKDAQRIITLFAGHPYECPDFRGKKNPQKILAQVENESIQGLSM